MAGGPAPRRGSAPEPDGRREGGGRGGIYDGGGPSTTAELSAGRRRARHGGAIATAALAMTLGSLPVEKGAGAGAGSDRHSSGRLPLPPHPTARGPSRPCRVPPLPCPTRGYLSSPTPHPAVPHPIAPPNPRSLAAAAAGGPQSPQPPADAAEPPVAGARLPLMSKSSIYSAIFLRHGEAPPPPPQSTRPKRYFVVLEWIVVLEWMDISSC